MRTFLMERASFILELIDKMLEKTSRKKRPNTKKRGPLHLAADAAALARRDDDDTSNGREAALSEFEKKMNANETLHPVISKFPLLDARITACRHCSKRLVNFAAAVHYHEYHSCSILDDHDSAVAERMKTEGAV
mmetsp:Transcript_32260/g.55047  ORF Transcript_32260/g.55047 Transcript_32260/m.55047 type:complete len:135 (+) Transcript_32260:1417-1821(+)